MWKKLMAVLVCCLALVVGACGETASTAAPAGGNKAAAAADSSAAAEGKTLVVYFSNTGNTKKVAEALAQETGGTLYAIEAAQPYTAADLDYNNNDSRSVKEHKDPSIRPAIKGDVADWGSYKTVYIGYPIWWGHIRQKNLRPSSDLTGLLLLPAGPAPYILKDRNSIGYNADNS